MRIIGLMSGTSLDGLDVAYCEFSDSSHFQLLAAETYNYPASWQRRLATLHEASAEEYALADVELGRFFAERLLHFREKHPGRVDLVASHGHTVFHQPERGLTAQIGDGNVIHALTGLPVVGDFRRLDVALGGQGAPLVPMGDRLLFGDYDACLNLGGIANISYEADGRRVAYDVVPCNMALNHLAGLIGMTYDAGGQLARGGAVVTPLLARLETLEYYHVPPPKTLGKEWFLRCFLPVLETFGAQPIGNLLCTVSEHIALRLAASIQQSGIEMHRVLVTGGGANNQYLLEQFKEKIGSIEIDSIDRRIVDFKEAIIFALLAYLRAEGRDNTLASVTGACRDSCGGALYGVIRTSAG
ncbi:MAG: anhydro-N-acetylmuramic acid kinase [Bacteroidales bacterium]|nr:anhydro-N-acetylmuramic acid kinase [Bacteroidales bacterium]